MIQIDGDPWRKIRNAEKGKPRLPYGKRKR